MQIAGPRQATLPGKNSYLVWFDEVKRNDMPDIGVMKARRRIGKVAELSDGKVYTVEEQGPS
jgi:hypothetical protein